MLDLREVADRLKAHAPSYNGRVFGSAELEGLETEPLAKPVAFVYPVSEAPGPNVIGQGVRQEVRVTFGVLTGVRNLQGGPRRFEAGYWLLATPRAELEAALINWQPASADDVCIYGGGRLLNIDQGTLWWVDEFVTATTIRRT